MIESGLRKIVLDRDIRMPFIACGQCCADQATGDVREQMQYVACSVAIQGKFVRNVCNAALRAGVNAAIAVSSH